MKTNSLIKVMTLVLLITSLHMGFISCSSDNEPLTPKRLESIMEIDETWIKPIEFANPEAAEVKAYFLNLRKEYNLQWEVMYRYFIDYTEYTEETAPSCIIINSAEQMDLAFPMGTPAKPEIDFNKYTFVLGFICLSSSERIYDINKIVLKPTEDGMEIKVPVLSPDYKLADYTPQYFCNIYPKFIGVKEVSILKVPLR